MQFPILNSMLEDAGLQQLTSSWPEKYFAVHGTLERLPELFSADILTSVESLTEAYNGSVCEFDLSKGSDKMYRVADARADEVINRGNTVYLQDLSPLLSNAGAFVRDLESELGIKPGSIRLTAFASAAGSGAPVHYDIYDVISIQLVGSKKFHLSPVEQIRFPYGKQYGEGDKPFDEIYPQISSGFPSAKNQTFEQIDMVPGSVLMMPRGTWHYTEAEQDSMAISIVLSPPTQIEYLLSGLKSTLLQSPAWRSPCYGISGKADSVSKLYSNLSNTIYKLTKNYQNPNSPLRSFHKNSRYLCNPGTEIQVTPGETVSQVEYQGVNKEGIPGTIRMEVPRDIASVLHSMTTRNGPFTVGECMKDFPGVSQDDFRELFSRAEGTGLLRKLWFVDL